MEVIVHIGYPKTASTWLQNEFFPKITNVVYYNKPIVNRLLCNNDFFLLNPNEIIDAFGKVDRLLLSSEDFVTTFQRGWNYGSLAVSNALKVKEVFPNAKIVLFIREQKSIICSAYQQYIKNGGTYSLHRYIYGKKNFHFEHLLYDRIIDFYDSLFGKESVYVYLYEDFKKNPSVFLNTLNNDLNFNIDLDLVSQNYINEGLRFRMYHILRIINLFSSSLVGKKFFLIPIRGVHKINLLLYKYLNKYPIMGQYIKTQQLNTKDISFIDSFYSKSNSKLVERIGKENLVNNGYPLSYE